MQSSCIFAGSFITGMKPLRSSCYVCVNEGMPTAWFVVTSITR